MTEEEFGKWYRAHIKEMAAAGIMHPNSEGGKWVKIALMAANMQYGPIIDQLQKRIVALEAVIHGDKPKMVMKQSVPEIEVVEEKPKRVAQPKPKAVPKAKTKVESSKQINTKKPVKKTWSV